MKVLQRIVDYPCHVYNYGVGSNSILCNKCKPWIHKYCSGITCRLNTNENVFLEVEYVYVTMQKWLHKQAPEACDKWKWWNDEQVHIGNDEF